MPFSVDIPCDGNDCALYTMGAELWTRRFFKLSTKFDISAIPDYAIILLAIFYAYCTQQGTQSVSFDCKRFQSQTWVETDTYATLNAIGMGASLGSFTTAGLTLNAFNAFNVRWGDNTDGLEADLVAGNQYFSPILHWADSSPLPNIGTENGDPNNFGYNSVSGDLWTTFTSAEGASNRPYLRVEYILPAGRNINRRFHGRLLERFEGI